MQPKTLLILTLLVAGLGSFIFLYEKDLPSTDERIEQSKRVLKLEDDAIDSLRIEWDDQSVHLERQRPSAANHEGGDYKVGESESTEAAGASLPGPNDQTTSGGWRILSPLAARADAAAVDSLLSSLVELEHSRILETIDRGELGLEEPRLRVTLESATGQTVVEIGAEIPSSSDMIVALAGADTAYQVGSSIFDSLRKEPGDWRDKTLFTASRGAIERVSLTGSGEKVLLARRGDDFWIESPLADPADEDKVNALMSALTGLEVATFLDEPLLTPESMGLEPAQGVVEVQLVGQEQPFRLALGHSSDAAADSVFYGRIDSQLFEVKTPLGESLAATAAEWRSKAWTTTQVFKIESASFEDADGTLAITRDGADWQRGEDRIAYATVSDLLYPIAESKGEAILERSAAVARGHDLGTPELTIALTTQDSAEELALFAVVDGLAAATTADREAVLLLPEDKVTEIRNKLQALRSAEPIVEEPAAGLDKAEEESDSVADSP